MNKIKFGNDWLFSLDGAEKQRVDVPHDFSICQKRKPDSPSGASGGYFLGGVGTYEKTFKAKKNKKYFLMSEGAFGIAEVFINNNSVYINKYPYNCFVADLSGYIRGGEQNTLKVRVSNKNLPSARWYTGAGLYRDVYLCECDGSYIDPHGAFVWCEAIEDNTAYMSVETRFVSSEAGVGVLEFEVFEDGKRKIITSLKKDIYADRGENKTVFKFSIENPKIWDTESPNMYKIKATLKIGEATDTEESVFGIRTVRLDGKRGFLLNGKETKLRGGCVHHDLGPLGSATHPEAEYRRIAKLKEAGFNAVRCSHNPQSPHFYDACDRLGMLVIDELFDYWTDGKQESDFHAFFADNYVKWIDEIVRANRNHPSVIMWSTGNEIPQKSGRSNGYFYARDIADNIRLIDTSRPLTHSLCSLWDDSEEYKRELETNGAPATEMDYWAQKTAPTADTVDAVGYNYLEYRIDRDLIRFPSRLIINTETFPLCAYTTIKQLLSNPRILGDFVWTAWDYFGETGIGHVDYHTQGEGFRLLEYPYHIAGCGDIDIIGRRKPQSYYREIAWGLRKEPYIASRHPSLTEIKHYPSAWGFYECESTWTYDGFEGKELDVYVFAECDEMILEINGKEIERQSRTDNGVYVFRTEYHPGKITAKSVVNGKITATSSLETVEKATKICLEAEKSYVPKGAAKPNSELVYVDVSLRDEKMNLCMGQDTQISYEATDADIVGIASADPKTERIYTSCECETYLGRAVVVLKKHKGAKKITLSARAQGFNEATLRI